MLWLDMNTFLIIFFSFLFSLQYNLYMFFFVCLVSRLIFLKTYSFWWIGVFLVISMRIKDLYENSIIDININLFNGLVLLHPVVVAFVYAFLCFYISLNFIKIFKFKDFFYFKKKFKFSLFYLALLATMFGAWWAQQELNWGGWWGWDVIELGSLFIFLYTLLEVHGRFNAKKKFFFFWVFFFFGVRFGFFISIHSFLANDSNAGFVYLISCPIIIFTYTFFFEKNLIYHGLVAVSLFFILETLKPAEINIDFLVASLSISWVCMISYRRRVVNLIWPLPAWLLMLVLLVKKKRIYHFFVFLFSITIVFFKLTIEPSDFLFIDDDFFLCGDEFLVTIFTVFPSTANINSYAYMFNSTLLNFFWNTALPNFQVAESMTVEIFQQSIILGDWRSIMLFSAFLLSGVLASFTLAVLVFITLLLNF